MTIKNLSGVSIIDASVAIEFLIELNQTTAAQKLFDRLRAPDSDLEFWAPDLLYPECVSALRKLERRRAISAPAAARAVEQLARLPITTVGTVQLLPWIWKLRGSVTAYDAAYMSLAITLDAPLITGDERLARARPRGGPKMIRLSEIA